MTHADGKLFAHKKRYGVVVSLVISLHLSTANSTYDTLLPPRVYYTPNH